MLCTVLIVAMNLLKDLINFIDLYCIIILLQLCLLRHRSLGQYWAIICGAEKPYMTTYKSGSIWTLMDIVHGRDACRDPGPLNYLLKFCPEW